MTEPKDYLAAEDMAGLRDAEARVRFNTERDCDSSPVDIHRLMVEYDRMRGKLDQITQGKSIMILNDEDRALPIMDISDEALVAWTRPTIAFLHNAQMRIGEERGDGRGIDALMMMSGVISGARMCVNANAGRMAYIVSGARDKAGELGDWQLIIEKHEGPSLDDMIEVLTADEADTVTMNCANPDADSVDVQHAVDVSGDWTEYKDVRYFGATQYQSVLAAYNARQAYDNGDPA